MTAFIGRREFITLLGGVAAAWPLAARAQQSEKIWRVGVLETTTAKRNATNLFALKQALLDLGYVEGRNLAMEYRSADGRAERFEELAAELVRLNIDVILARGTPAILAAKKASGTIPVVMTASANPFTSVTSLARPGGNVTGLSSLSSDLYTKRVELIKETVPALTRMGVMSNPTNPNAPRNVSEVEKAARSLSIELHKFDLRTPDDIPLAFEMASRQRGGRTYSFHRNGYSGKCGVHHATCCQAASASDLCGSGVCRDRRVDELRRELPRPLSSRGDLRGQDIQGREARRLADRAADQV
jgi:putative ABC transport system substrate-binding protein